MVGKLSFINWPENSSTQIDSPLPQKNIFIVSRSNTKASESKT